MPGTAFKHLTRQTLRERLTWYETRQRLCQDQRDSLDSQLQDLERQRDATARSREIVLHRVGYARFEDLWAADLQRMDVAIGLKRTQMVLELGDMVVAQYQYPSRRLHIPVHRARVDPQSIAIAFSGKSWQAGCVCTQTVMLTCSDEATTVIHRTAPLAIAFDRASTVCIRVLKAENSECILIHGQQEVH